MILIRGESLEKAVVESKVEIRNELEKWNLSKMGLDEWANSIGGREPITNQDE
jgi:hypothetical protein